MSFEYINPISSVIVQAPNSVYRDNDTGTNFSVLGIGGYMEVYNLSDLDWVIPNDILINGGPPQRKQSILKEQQHIIINLLFIKLLCKNLINSLAIILKIIFLK